MKKLLFVYNPLAGNGKASKKTAKIISVFSDGGYGVTAYPTSSPHDAETYTAAHAAEFSMIVACGGDGTFHEVLNGLRACGSDVPCGYIPTGTFNDYASSLGIPSDPVKAAKVIVSGSQINVDAGLFGDKMFSYVAAAGIFTEVGYTTSQRAKNAVGRLAYYLKVLSDLKPSNFSSSSFHARINADGNEYECDVIYALIGTCTTVAGVKSVLPEDASMTDGLFDHLFIKVPKTIKDIDLIKRSLINRRFDPEVMISGKAKQIVIHTDRPVKWTLDGEYGGETDCAVTKCLPGAVKITVSPGASV